MPAVFFTVVLLALQSLVVPSNGLAAKPKVAVLPYQPLDKDVPEELAEQATVVITKEMAAGGLTVVRTEDVEESDSKAASGAPKPGKDARRDDTPKPSDTPVGDAAAGTKAEELIARAKAAVEESEFQVAIETLKKAVRLLEENGDAVPDLRLLSQAYLELGVAYFRDGMEEEGDEMLSHAVHFDPGRSLDPSAYPPIFVRVFDRARSNVLRRPRARIEVQGPPGAQVLFDGRSLGKLPLVLAEALPGAHWIRIERPGERTQVRKLSVRSKQTVTVEFEGSTDRDHTATDSGKASDGVLGAIVRNEITREHVGRVRAAGARLGADFVMIGGIYKSDTAYNLRTAYVSVKDGSVGRLIDIAFDLDMLSAEIEVYKLAEDAKTEAERGKFRTPEASPVFPIALKLKSRPLRVPPKIAAAVTIVVAAPPAPSESRNPTPLVAKPMSPSSSIVPKDEVADEDPIASPAAVRVTLPSSTSDRRSAGASISAGASMYEAPYSGSSGTSTTLQRNSMEATDPDEDDGSPWWIWALVGVAAAGAAAAGGYLVLTGQTPDEGSLRIRW